jgi:hypothetical protein
VADLSNMLFSGPHENILDHERIGAREGQVICAVRARPLAPRDGARTFRREIDGEKAWFVGANVECTIYAQGARAVQQIGAVERALRRLASA